MNPRFFPNEFALRKTIAITLALKLVVLRRLAICALLLFLSHFCSAQQCTGAPTYNCAATFPFLDPLPATLPNWGGLTGANTKFCDTRFDSGYSMCYVRLTDGNTSPWSPNNSFVVQSVPGRYFNLNDTMLVVQNTGAALYFFDINSSTLATSLVSAVTPSNYCCNGQWSQTNSEYYYTLTLGGTITRLNLANLSGNPPQPAATSIYSFGSNCGLTFSEIMDFSGPANNDTVFFAVFNGPQDTNSAIYAAVYNSSSGNCYLYNSNTGVETVYNSSGSVVHTYEGLAGGFFFHGGNINDPTGTHAILTQSSLSSGGPAYYSWNWIAGTVTPCTVSACAGAAGHTTSNALGFFENNNIESSNYPNVLYWTWANWGGPTFTNINTGGTSSVNPTMDMHPSTNNDASGTNGYPVFASTVDTNPTFSTYSNEIIAFQQPGQVLRFGHTFSDPGDPNFQAHNAIGTVSSTGNLFAVTTNALGTLGSMPAYIESCSESGTTATCTTWSLTTAQWPTGSSIVVSGNSVGGYNGTWTITGQTSTSLSFKVSSSGLGSGTGGIASEAACTLSLGNCRSDVFVLSLVPVPGNMTLTSSPNPSVVGQPVTFTATVSGVNGVTPTGTVTFYFGYGYANNSSEIGGTNYPGNPATLSNGQAGFSWTFNVPKNPAYIYAVYPGDAHYGPSYSPMLNQVVNQ